MIDKLVYKCKIKGLDYIENNNITIGINALIQGIKIDNKDIDLLNILGLCLFKQCKFNEAAYVFQKSSLLESKKAKEYIKYLESKEYKYLKSLYNKGIDFLKENKFLNAKEVFENIVILNEDLIEPYCILTEINLVMENYEEANKWLDRFMEKDVGSDKIAKYKMYIKKKREKKSNSIESKINNNEIAEFRFLLGMSYEEVGNFEMAVEEYKRYLKESKKKNYEECALYNLVRLLNKLGKEEEKNFYKENLEINYGKKIQK